MHAIPIPKILTENVHKIYVNSTQPVIKTWKQKILEQVILIAQQQQVVVAPE